MKSSQQRQLENSYSSLMLDAHRGSFIVLYVKNQGNDERLRVFPKSCEPKGQGKGGGGGVGGGGKEKAKTQWSSICGTREKRL